MLDRERLDEHCSAERLAESKDVERMLAGEQPRNPAMDVAGFEQAVGRNGAAAFSVRAAVGREHGESMLQKHGSEPHLARARVRDSVEDQDRVTIGLGRCKQPRPQCYAIARRDLDHARPSNRGHRPARRMHGRLAQHNARKSTQPNRNSGNRTEAPEDPSPRHHLSIRSEGVESSRRS